MLKYIKINFKQVSLFPVLTKKNTSFLYKKIYTRHFLYFFGMLELNNINKNKLGIKLSKGFFNKKKLKHSTQILRSPNRHKVAQFHVIKKFYNINFSFKILCKNTKINQFASIISLMKNTFNLFESSMIYTKNVKIGLHSILKLKLIN